MHGIDLSSTDRQFAVMSLCACLHAKCLVSQSSKTVSVNAILREAHPRSLACMQSVTRGPPTMPSCRFPAHARLKRHHNQPHRRTCGGLVHVSKHLVAIHWSHRGRWQSKPSPLDYMSAQTRDHCPKISVQSFSFRLQTPPQYSYSRVVFMARPHDRQQHGCHFGHFLFPCVLEDHLLTYLLTYFLSQPIIFKSLTTIFVNYH